jgi:hypothetical protein
MAKVEDFWLDLSIALAVLTFCYLILALVLLSKVNWSCDRLSKAIVAIFITSYAGKNRNRFNFDSENIALIFAHIHS